MEPGKEEIEKPDFSEEPETQLLECQKQRDEYLAGWQRARADFLNYKKDEMERIGEFFKYANEELILKILPILDNIYIAENTIPPDLKNNQWIGGILQIKTQMLDFLKNQGVEEIKSAGKKFDPNFHEVLEESGSKDGESGAVVEEIQKGYILNGKILRPAKVKVAK